MRSVGFQAFPARAARSVHTVGTVFAHGLVGIERRPDLLPCSSCVEEPPRAAVVEASQPLHDVLIAIAIERLVREQYQEGMLSK